MPSCVWKASAYQLWLDSSRSIRQTTVHTRRFYCFSNGILSFFSACQLLPTSLPQDALHWTGNRTKNIHTRFESTYSVRSFINKIRVSKQIISGTFRAYFNFPHQITVRQAQSAFHALCIPSKRYLNRFTNDAFNLIQHNYWGSNLIKHEYHLIELTSMPLAVTHPWGSSSRDRNHSQPIPKRFPLVRRSCEKGSGVVRHETDLRMSAKLMNDATA